MAKDSFQMLCVRDADGEMAFDHFVFLRIGAGMQDVAPNLLMLRPGQPINPSVIGDDLDSPGRIRRFGVPFDVDLSFRAAA